MMIIIWKKKIYKYYKEYNNLELNNFFFFFNTVDNT